MKTVVLGGGFLGTAFKKAGMKVWDSKQFYVTEENIDDIIHELDDFKVIINCMGKSNTRWCEENAKDAVWSNAVLPTALSEYCSDNDKYLVHISTGCLYDRNDRPQRESDFIAAHCQYTMSKWLGESMLDLDHDLVIRPRLFFGDFEDRNNLLCKLPNFDRFVNELNSYTSVHTIVNATRELIKADQRGIFNVACDGWMTVHQVAELMGIEGDVMSEEELHHEQGLYLVNNTMDISKLKQFYKPPKLEDEIKRCIEALNNK